MSKRRLPLNLQFFSEEKSEEENNENVENKSEEQQTEIEGKLYTEEDLQKAIKARVDRELKAKAKEVEEAKKLAKMNEAEKQKYEYEKLQEENERLKAEQNKWSLGKEASNMLSEHQITATDEILEFVVGKDADETSERVKAFTALVEEVSNSIVQEKLRGNAPTRSASTNAHTRESIMDVKDSSERLRLIQEHPELFN